MLFSTVSTTAAAALALLPLTAYGAPQATTNQPKPAHACTLRYFTEKGCKPGSKIGNDRLVIPSGEWQEKVVETLGEEIQSVQVISSSPGDPKAVCKIGFEGNFNDNAWSRYNGPAGGDTIPRNIDNDYWAAQNIYNCHDPQRNSQDLAFWVNMLPAPVGDCFSQATIRGTDKKIAEFGGSPASGGELYLFPFIDRYW